MSAHSLFGAQWGDEGKGKIIDRMSAEMDLVVRYQGGANAGHTVVVGDHKYVLHLIPSGILHDGPLNVIGGGAAVDPLQLIKEIDGLAETGVVVTPDNLLVSATSHVIFEHHKRLDSLAEVWRGEGRIGTTGRGIGPCYADKAARTGLRMGDLLDADHCRERLRAALAEKNALIGQVHGSDTLELEEQLALYLDAGERLAPYITDTGKVLRQAYRDGKRLLFEGAQGVMLDLDHGTYPFVTSSNTGANGIPSGAAFPARWVQRVIGVAKAYCTRVGEGPFPSELLNGDAEELRSRGGEFGATTGRPRRCGWFDAVAVRYALDLNGADGWVMTKLDVLSGLGEIRAAVAYRVAGQTTKDYPAHLTELDNIEMVYESRPGWDEDISGIRRFEDLPLEARNYVEWLEELVGVPILMISVGPERDQVISRGLE